MKTKDLGTTTQTKVKVKVPIFFYSDSDIDFSGPELALHCWQLVGKTNVYVTAPTAALHILIASHTSARKDFDPQPKLLLICRPRTNSV